MVVYAKSDPLDNPQTLWTHSKEVEENSKCFQNLYNLDFLGSQKEYFWNALRLACKFHDLGKINARFQYNICRSINKQRKKHNIKKPDIDILELKSRQANIPNIPHNILSPAFMLSKIECLPKEIRTCVCSAVAFHHNRGLDYVSNSRWNEVRSVIHTDLKPFAKTDDLLKFFDDNTGDDVIIGDKYHYLLGDIPQDYMNFYVMLKGLLHRADYTASAGVEVSVDNKGYNRNVIKEHIYDIAKKYDSAWQIKALKDHLDENVIMRAGTGMGKTEFALYWASDSKTFYTLPMRTSTNAIYERIKYIFRLGHDSIGLLHSSAQEYFLSRDESMLPSTDTINHMRQMSMPVSVSTADQIFISVFKFPGYERMYATMAESKIIVDELQAYNPEIIAVILRGLADFECLGAKFCIITATLPEFCATYLDDKIPSKIAKPKPNYKTTPRHKIRLIDANTVLEIIQRYKAEKVLIIFNTVSAAIAMKRSLDVIGLKSNLLHSRFTYEDRHKKENDKNTGILHVKEGIWITTQVVEASVDIDFNVLITEISTMDSQIQRWGRIWRGRDRGPYTSSDPNIYIIKESSDKGSIYNSEMVKKTLDILESYNEITISDHTAVKMFDDVFSNHSLDGTKYLSSFYKSINMLDELNFKADNKQEAQRMFREINNISIIPKCIYDDNKKEFDEYIYAINHGDKQKRLKNILHIKQKTVSVPYNWNLKLETIDERYNIQVGNVKYTSIFGAEKP